MTGRFTPTHLALMPDGSYELGGYLQPDEPTPQHLVDFAEALANGAGIFEAAEACGQPGRALELFDGICRDLGPQAV